MKSALRAALLGVALLGWANSARAQITKSGAGYLFRVKYAKGQKLNYDMTVTILIPKGMGPQGGGTRTVTGPLRMIVTDVKGTTASIHIDLGPMIVSGKPASPAQKVDLQVDSHGNLTSAKPTGLENLFMPLPEKPMKVGESTTSAKTVAARGKSIKIATVTKFTGVQAVAGRQAAVFISTISAAGAPGSASGTRAFAVSDGTVVSSTIVSSTPVPGGSVRQQVALVRK